MMIAVTSVSAKSILSRASGYIQAYDYTLSPSKGCGFGCTYCYVPTLFFTPRHLAHAWGEQVEIKANAPELLRRAGEQGKLAGARIYFSPNTDPYQPHERGLPAEQRITRRLLEAFCDYPPRTLVMQTRAPWVIEDLDLLERLGPRVVVAMSVTTDREDVRRIFEPRCASIRLRVEALATLHRAGIRTQGSLAPLLPCDPDALAALVDPHCDWVVAQAFQTCGPGARTWSPALRLVEAHGWQGWLEGGADVGQAMARLREIFGPRYHEGRDGFSFPATSRS
jgi:DNA repair photolyase